MILSRSTISLSKKAAVKASVNSGSIRSVELACRYGRTAPLPEDRQTMTNLIDLDPETTDLWDKAPPRLTEAVEDSVQFPGCAILEFWTYSGRGDDIELQDTVYVGIADGAVVGASCHFEPVLAAVRAAKGGR